MTKSNHALFVVFLVLITNREIHATHPCSDDDPFDECFHLGVVESNGDMRLLIDTTDGSMRLEAHGKLNYLELESASASLIPGSKPEPFDSYFRSSASWIVMTHGGLYERPSPIALDGIYPLDVSWRTDGARDIILSSRLAGNEVVYVPEPSPAMLMHAMLIFSLARRRRKAHIPRVCLGV